MKIRARVKGIGELVEGWLVEFKGKPVLHCEIKIKNSLDKCNVCLYGIYLDTIEFYFNGEWINFIEGMNIVIASIGESGVPKGISDYFKDKIREQTQGKDN